MSNMTQTQAQTIGQAVATYRKSEAALRAIARNGGRTRATTHAVQRHELLIRQAELALLTDRQTALVGLLVEEAQLSERIASAPLERPELRGRLQVARMDIQRFVRLLGDREMEQ